LPDNSSALFSARNIFCQLYITRQVLEEYKKESSKNTQYWMRKAKIKNETVIMNRKGKEDDESERFPQMSRGLGEKGIKRLVASEDINLR
jgi:hypothetical protein